MEKTVTVHDPVSGEQLIFSVDESGYLDSGDLDRDCHMCGGGLPELVQWLADHGLAYFTDK